MHDITIAAIQMNAALGQVAENLATHERLARQAAAAGAELLCFPELGVTGHWCAGAVWTVAEPVRRLAPVPLADGGTQPERGAEEGSEAERGAEPPEDDLGELVEEVRRPDVLVRVGDGAGVADHRPLFRHGGEELAR